MTVFSLARGFIEDNMTDLTKPISRRTRETFRSTKGRRIVITLYPGDVIGLREERTRTTFLLPVEKVFQYAARVHAENVVKERKAKRRKNA